MLCEGEVGRLQVSGQVVTNGYLRNPKANAAAFTPDGWFKTGDLGFLLNEALTITGRENDVIIVNGRNIYVSELEEQVERVAGVEPSFAAAVPLKAVNSESVGVFFSASDTRANTADLVRAIRTVLVSSHGVNPALIVRLPQAEIPKTTIGKIQRSLLLGRLQAGELEHYVAGSDQTWRIRSENEVGIFEESWVSCVARDSSSLKPTGPILLFAPDVFSGEVMRSRTGAICVAVVPGQHSGWLDDHLYSLNEAEENGYAVLLSELHARQLAPTVVIHAWLTGRSWDGVSARQAMAEKLERGFFSMLRLLSAFARFSRSNLQVLGATRGAVPLAGESGADAVAALLSAFADTRRLSCRA